jgi:hypothetical protein
VKGGANERAIAKILQEWWSDHNPDVKFTRTPQSGGWHAKGEWNLAGDVVCSDEEFPFHIEAKKQEHWNLDQLFAATGPVFEWWWQARRECPEDKLPVLTFTRNRRPQYMMLEWLDGLYTLLSKEEATVILLCMPDSPNLLICTLDDFTSIAPSAILELL